MVLGVIPGSPAEALGITAGQTIVRVNGVRVAVKEDLHRALRQNPAYVKLELADENGEIRFMQRALYAGEHHQLGIILAPDEDVSYIVERAERPLAGYVWMKLAGLLRRLPPRAESGKAQRAGNAQGS
jgi:predicted metalloprotease with PDZ domain